VGVDTSHVDAAAALLGERLGQRVGGEVGAGGVALRVVVNAVWDVPAVLGRGRPVVDAHVGVAPADLECRAQRLDAVDRGPGRQRDLKARDRGLDQGQSGVLARGHERRGELCGRGAAACLDARSRGQRGDQAPPVPACDRRELGDSHLRRAVTGQQVAVAAGCGEARAERHRQREADRGPQRLAEEQHAGGQALVAHAVERSPLWWCPSRSHDPDPRRSRPLRRVYAAVPPPRLAVSFH
jgi:hypothetical protein